MYLEYWTFAGNIRYEKEREELMQQNNGGKKQYM